LFFDNVLASKRDIYKELKHKSGVYMVLNNITKDIYIGSSVNLTRRIAIHIFHAGSNKETNIVFYRAMRKYGLENFSLAIIEFCTSDSAVCLELEQKWIDYYQPKYNILKEARSSIGFQHSKETINKLKDMFSKENHPK
jgi:group I intron endonuclease